MARYFGERGSVVRSPKGRGDPFITNDSDVSKGLAATHCGGLGNGQFAFLSLSVSFGTPGNYFVVDLLAMRTEPQICRFDIGHPPFGLHKKTTSLPALRGGLAPRRRPAGTTGLQIFNWFAFNARNTVSGEGHPACRC